MKIEVGKTYKVELDGNGFEKGDIFTVEAFDEVGVWIEFDDGSPLWDLNIDGTMGDLVLTEVTS